MPDDTSTAMEEHRRSLMLKRRCSHCAERVRASILLRGRPCPRCQKVSSWNRSEDADALISALDQKWRRRRWWVYGILALGTFSTGMFPLVATLLALLAMVYARLVIVRRSLLWFGPGRRFTARFTIRAFMLTTGLMALVSNELLTLLPWANMPLKMLTSVFFTGLFVEGSLLYLTRTLRHEASEEHGLKWWEWGVPAGAVASAVCLSLASVATALLVSEAVSAMYSVVLSWF